MAQETAPFRYSGWPCFTKAPSREYQRFETETGIGLQPSVIDTCYYDGEWRGVSPRTEVVTCDFTERRRHIESVGHRRGQRANGTGEQLGIFAA